MYVIPEYVADVRNTGVCSRCVVHPTDILIPVTLHGVTSQKSAIFILTAVRTSILSKSSRSYLKVTKKTELHPVPSCHFSSELKVNLFINLSSNKLTTRDVTAITEVSN
jgi:hypothetical protein